MKLVQAISFVVVSSKIDQKQQIQEIMINLQDHLDGNMDVIQAAAEQSVKNNDLNELCKKNLEIISLVLNDDPYLTEEEKIRVSSD